MNAPRVVSRDEWLAARRDLLAREKEATRATDTVAAARRQLPAVEVTKNYVFTGPEGQVNLAGTAATSITTSTSAWTRT